MFRHNLGSISGAVWAVVLAQLVEWLIPILVVSSSNPVIGKNLYWTLTVNCIEKTNIKKKRPAMAHFKKITWAAFVVQQLAERLIPTPKSRSSNPIHHHHHQVSFLSTLLYRMNGLRRRKNRTRDKFCETLKGKFSNQRKPSLQRQ